MEMTIYTLLSVFSFILLYQSQSDRTLYPNIVRFISCIFFVVLFTQSFVLTVTGWSGTGYDPYTFNSESWQIMMAYLYGVLALYQLSMAFIETLHLSSAAAKTNVRDKELYGGI